MNFEPSYFSYEQQTESVSNEVSTMDLLTVLNLGKSPTPHPSLVGIGRVPDQKTVLLPTTTHVVVGGGEEISPIQFSQVQKKQDIFSLYDNEEGISTQGVSWKDKNKLVSNFKRNQYKLKELISEYVIVGVMSEEMKKNVSIVTVVKPGTSGEQTINDPKMGVVPPDITCITCKLDLSTCPGHFGRIKFNSTGKQIPSYIYHPLFIRDTENVLSCVCHDCGSLRVTEKQIQEVNLDYLSGFARLKAISAYCTKKGKLIPCPGTNIKTYEASGEASNISPCEISLPFKTSKTDREMGKLRLDSKESNEFSINEAYSILDKISDADKTLLGFGEHTHPRDFILKSILIIPPAYRGASIHIQGSYSTDKLGEIYSQIVKKNNELNNTNKDIILKDIYMKYDMLLSNTVDKEKGKRNQFSGILSMLRTKKGVFRSVALGKRVDFTARSVIGPNPFLSVEEVGIPMIWKQYLTRPVVVTGFNKRELLRKLRNGQIVSYIPGGGKAAGYTKRIMPDNIESIRLKIGDICNRWLENGDYVTLNRQPSIHKRSIMGLRVILIDSSNIQLNPTYTSAFNADFDGDEMNIHLPQTPEAAAEVMLLLALKHCLLDEQANSPMIGLIMSDVTSAYLLTLLNPVIDIQLWISSKTLLTETKQLVTLDARLNEAGVRRYSGFGLFSMTLPENFQYNKDGVIIRNGIMISGILTKKHIGKSGNSIYHTIEKDYGADRTTALLDDTSRILNRFLTSYGFSIGLESCTHTDTKLMDLKEEQIAIMKMMVMQLGTKLEDPIEEENRKREIILLLDKPKNMTTKLLKDTFGPLNAMAIMIVSGAKASAFNAAQMRVMLGQSYIRGEIFPHNMTNQSRALPVFEPNDPSPAAFGFIDRSFSEGLRPSHMFFHAAGTRENLADTALKTQDVGKVNRNLQMSLADYKVNYDGTIRNANNEILQFIYGDDGFNPAHLESIDVNGENIPFFINLNRNIKRLNEKYGYSDFTQKEIPESMVEDIVPKLTLYIPPSSDQQIGRIVAKGGNEKIRQVINYYVKDMLKTLNMLRTYDDDDTIYKEIREINTYNDESENKLIVDKYVNYTDELVQLDEPEQKYLNLGSTDFAIMFGKVMEYEENDIYGLSNTDEGNFRKLSGDKLPFSDSMFRLITAIDFINHQINLPEILLEINRVLDDEEGYLLLREYESSDEIDRMEIDVDHMIRLNIEMGTKEKDEDLYEGSKLNYYGNYMSKSTLAQHLENAGFERIKYGNEEDSKINAYYALYKKI